MEIACTVIFFILGFMSQLKIWKVVKERREKKLADQFQDEESREHLEAAIGQRIEGSNARERAQWERVYGDKDSHHRVPNDSGFISSPPESIRKSSVSVNEFEDVELADMPRASEAGSNTRQLDDEGKPWKGKEAVVTVRIASEDSVQKYNATESGASTPPHADSLGKNGESSSESLDTNKELVRTRSLRPSARPPPPIVPLPFSPLRQSQTSGVADYTVSAEGLYGTIPEEDDRSSVAVTVDDPPDMDLFSTPGSPFLDPSPDGEIDEMLALGSESLRKPTAADEDGEDGLAEEEDPERLQHPERETSLAKFRRATGDSNSPGEESQPALTRPTATSVDTSVPLTPHSKPDMDDAASLHSLKERLPSQMPKVAMTYRTNEWAKHLEAAEKPELETLSLPESPGTRVDLGFAEAVKAAGRERPRESLDLRAEHANQRWNDNNLPQNYVYSQGQATPNQTLSRSSSGMTLNSTNSVPRRMSAVPSTRLTTNGLRNSSAPLLHQPLIESPIEDILAASTPYRRASQPIYASSPTLLNQRDLVVRNKTNSMSFANLTLRPNFALTAPTDAGSVRSVPFDADDDTILLSERRRLLTGQPSDPNMTLAERRAALQQRQQATWPTPQNQQQQPQTADQRIIYDSHQPVRASLDAERKQYTLLTQWRASQGPAPNYVPQVADEKRRAEMLEQKRREQWERERRRKERKMREVAFDELMRRGESHDTHRELIRAMQRRADTGT